MTFGQILAFPFLQVIAATKWLAGIFTEPDGNGGKASYARVAGSVVIYNIIAMVWKGVAVPEIMETMFWVLVGYQLLSKTLNSMSPAVLAIAQGMLLKIQAPKPAEEPKP
jgi:hypothetical protein